MTVICSTEHWYRHFFVLLSLHTLIFGFWFVVMTPRFTNNSRIKTLPFWQSIKCFSPTEIFFAHQLVIGKFIRDYKWWNEQFPRHDFQSSVSLQVKQILAVSYFDLMLQHVQVRDGPNLNFLLCRNLLHHSVTAV